jgi:hypothetical protein
MLRKTLFPISLLILCVLIFLSSCTHQPSEVAVKFLDALQGGQYDAAQQRASPQLQQQIEVIIQDKAALFNGQEWSYDNMKASVTGGTAKVTYLCKLKDGSQVWQMATLTITKGGWQVENIRNTKIIYSAKALRNRNYWESGSQMLITPLDLEDITPDKLRNNTGRFIMVSGYLCDFKKNGQNVVIAMGTEDRKPLLTVTVKGEAKDSAEKERTKYQQIDSMVASPLGNVFTAIGILQVENNQPAMSITNPQNLIIGQVLRVEEN